MVETCIVRGCPFYQKTLVSSEVERHDFVIISHGCYDGHHIYEVKCNLCAYSKVLIYECSVNPNVPMPYITSGGIIMRPEQLSLDTNSDSEQMFFDPDIGEIMSIT